MKRIVTGLLAGLLAALAAIVCVVLVRTARFGAAAAHQPEVVQAGHGAVRYDAPVDSGAPARLAAAVRVPTVSYFDSSARIAAFQQLHATLATAFPRLHRGLEREVLDSAGLLFTWRGSDTTLAPVVLMGHLDVVPVEPGTESAWEHPPFSGAIAGGYVWGRGTLDDKGSVLATMEAVESLLGQGYAPRRTVLLAFGYTEEKGGPSMPRLIATLRARGVKPAFVVDEGGFITEGLVPGVPGPIALVGTSEKGYASVRLTAHGPEGHSSAPPRQTAVGILARAITRLEDSPMPARLAGAPEAMFETLGPAMPFSRRMVLANLWLFRPVLLSALAKQPTSDATIRTTTAPTMLQGSTKDNVLPGTATAVVNFRILPGDDVAGVVRHVRDVVGDARVRVDTIATLAVDPSPESPTTSDGFRALHDAIVETWPTARVTPYLVIGATDSRYFAALTPNVYRFAPFRVVGGDIARVHGTNERIGVENYVDGVRFVRRLVVRATE